MEQVRLIALDLDGTLLDDRKEVPPENISGHYSMGVSPLQKQRLVHAGRSR